MVSRPTHKPIPIPLSVPIEEDDHSFDSVDDLLASIRDLVSPGAVAVVDLNRPVQDQPTMTSKSGKTESNGVGNIAPQGSDGPRSVLSDSVGQVQCGEKWNLSEKTLSESTKVLASLMNALEGPSEESTGESEQTPSDSSRRADDCSWMSQGIGVDALVAKCLNGPLDAWIQQNESWITDHIKTMIDQRMVELLHQWLNAYLPEVIKASVDRHLDSLIQSVQKK